MPHALFPTAFGTCGLAWNDAGLTRFSLPEASPELTARRLGAAGPAVEIAEAPAAVQDVAVRAQRHLGGDLQDFSGAALDTSVVSAFELRVYVRTCAIPAGQVGTYGRIAADLGLGAEAARAVGAALGANPWPLVVPCHRVVAASGKMTGFSAPGGVRTKTRLLALEGAELLSE